MPAAKAGESKQALVVTLVFFILLSIILSVLWYMSFSEADKLAKDKTTAENAEKSAKNEGLLQRNLVLLYRGYMGVRPADELELKVAYEDYAAKVAGKNDKDGNDKTLAKLEKDLGWDKAKGLPNNDMVRKVAELEKQKKDMQDQVAQKDEEVKKREAELKTARTQRDAIEAESKKRFEELKERADKDLKKYDQDIQKARDDFGDSGKTIAQKNEDIENLQKENAKLLAAKNKEIKDLQTRLNKLEDRRPAAYASLTADQPKGKIVLMDKTGSLPYVNLGSADGVKPQLSFSIHGIGADGRPLKESKGSLEITHVVREHLSQARITQQVDQARDPVAAGDVLINAAWDPNEKRHVAIAGIVDLTGDVRTDRPADARRAVESFIRTLENQNMVVDAWLDFGDNSIKGKGISRATDYLIAGTVPEGKSGVVREDDPNARRRDDVQKLYTKMLEEATRAGVPIIKLRDFLAMTGQRPPRRTQQDDSTQIHSSVPAAGSPVEKSVPAPRPNDDGKDKEGKDNKDKDKDK